MIETPESAFFDPAITNASTPVEGEELRVETAVTNTGDLTDTQTVSLEIGGETVDTVENVSLEGRESTAVTLGWDTTVGDNGTYDATVTTANESDTESVAVAEAVAGPSFDVAISEVNDSVPAGEDLFVDVTVANVGKESGSAAIDLDVDGDSIDSQTVDLEADDETTLTFVYPTDDEDPSALDVTVTSPDDTDTTTARVTSPEPAFFEVDLVDPPAEVAAADNVTIQSTVANVGSVAATQELELVVDETVVDASTVSLNGSETGTVNMTWETAENETGERNVSVTSRNETATTTLEVGTDGESDDGDGGGGGGGIVLPNPVTTSRPRPGTTNRPTNQPTKRTTKLNRPRPKRAPTTNRRRAVRTSRRRPVKTNRPTPKTTTRRRPLMRTRAEADPTTRVRHQVSVCRRQSSPSSLLRRSGSDSVGEPIVGVSDSPVSRASLVETVVIERSRFRGTIRTPLSNR